MRVNNFLLTLLISSLCSHEEFLRKGNEPRNESKRRTQNSRYDDFINFAQFLYKHIMICRLKADCGGVVQSADSSVVDLGTTTFELSTVVEGVEVRNSNDFVLIQ